MATGRWSPFGQLADIWSFLFVVEQLQISSLADTVKIESGWGAGFDTRIVRYHTFSGGRFCKTGVKLDGGAMKTCKDSSVDKDISGSGSEEEVGNARRQFLKTAGKFAVYTPPAMMMLMKPSHASVMYSVVGRPKGNNGIGNGLDGQPPGNPKPNDTPGIYKGNRPHQEDR